MIKYDYAIREVLGQFDKLGFQVHGAPNPIGMYENEQKALLWAAMQSNLHYDWLEIGSFYGGSAALLGLTLKTNNSKAKLYSVDRWRFDGAFHTNMTNAGLLQTVVEINCDSFYLCQNYPTHSPLLSLVFIDGWHSFKAVIHDFEAIAPFLIRGAHVVFHDCVIANQRSLEFHHARSLEHYEHNMQERLPNVNPQAQTYGIERAVAYIAATEGFALVTHPYDGAAVTILRKL